MPIQFSPECEVFSHHVDQLSRMQDLDALRETDLEPDQLSVDDDVQLEHRRAVVADFDNLLT